MSAAISWVPRLPHFLSDDFIFFLLSSQYFLPHTHSQLIPLLPTSLKKIWKNQKRSPTDSCHGYPPPRTLYTPVICFFCYQVYWANCSQRPALPWAPDPISISCLFQLSLLSLSLHILSCCYFFHQTTNRTKQTQKTAFEVLLLSSCWPISLLPFIAKFLERFICSFVSFLLSLPEMYSNSALSLTMPLKLLLPGLYFHVVQFSCLFSGLVFLTYQLHLIASIILSSWKPVHCLVSENFVFLLSSWSLICWFLLTWTSKQFGILNMICMLVTIRFIFQCRPVSWISNSCVHLDTWHQFCMPQT